MPRLKSEPLAELSPVKAATLFDREIPAGGRYALALSAEPGVDPVKELWDEHRDAVLEAWIRERLGTRPSLWWRVDAPRWNAPKEYRCWYYVPMLPEPRLRLGGVGRTAWERYPAYVPSWAFGIPDIWYEVDEDDPPSFESQAAYLRRHGLLFPGEEGLLTAAAFEPEIVGQ